MRLYLTLQRCAIRLCTKILNLGVFLILIFGGFSCSKTNNVSGFRQQIRFLKDANDDSQQVAFTAFQISKGGSADWYMVVGPMGGISYDGNGELTYFTSSRVTLIQDQCLILDLDGNIVDQFSAANPEGALQHLIGRGYERM